ncbi:sensor histidine kinase [bacterium]|nr:sensor histidine kinase [bacterium]
MESGDPARMRWNNLKIVTSAGDVRYVHAYNIPIIDQNLMISTVQDVTDRKVAEDQIKASLKEKDLLLHEIHHRVKNNMQVISSLLDLQSNSIENEQAKEILKVSQGRVRALAAVHETLHESESLSEIDLQSYLSRLTIAVFDSYSVQPDRINLNYEIEDCSINISQASTVGLIINELITNALKYAFPGNRKGEICVRLNRSENQIELIVKDDGIGFPDDVDWRNTNSLGLKLVRSLSEDQLGGSIDMESQNGTRFTIKFNIEA